MRTLTIITLSFLMLTTMSAQHFQFSFQPQYFIFNGFRTDFDVRVNSKDTWLSVSPIFYAKEGTDYRYDEEDYKKLSGYGGSLELINYYTVNPDKNYKLFWSAGVQYIYYDIIYEASGWNTTEYEGLEALVFGWSDRTTTIDQYTLNLSFGSKWYFDERMFIELYLGTRIKYAEHQFSDEFVQRKFNSYRLSVGYKGIVPNVGMKFGVSL